MILISNFKLLPRFLFRRSRLNNHSTFKLQTSNTPTNYKGKPKCNLLKLAKSSASNRETVPGSCNQNLNQRCLATRATARAAPRAVGRATRARRAVLRATGAAMVAGAVRRLQARCCWEHSVQATRTAPDVQFQRCAALSLRADSAVLRRESRRERVSVARWALPGLLELGRPPALSLGVLPVADGTQDWILQSSATGGRGPRLPRFSFLQHYHDFVFRFGQCLFLYGFL